MKKSTQIDSILSQLSDPQRKTLTQVRKTMASLMPTGSEETISYGLPAFRGPEGKIIGGFAATKKHCSYYPFSGGVLPKLKKILGSYRQTKGALHFPCDRPLSRSILKKLISVRLKEIRSASRK